MVPTFGFKLHVTVWLLVPATDAANCCVPDALRLVVPGFTETATEAAAGWRLTRALANFVVSATLMAVMVTVWEEDITAGAVYRPLVIEPMAGFKFHVTAGFTAPETDGENCCVCDALRVVTVGVSDTLTGTRLTVAVANLVVSAALVPVMITV